MVCPNCKSHLRLGALSCPKCGVRFKTKICPYCKAQILSNAIKCPKCGKALSQPSVPTASQKKAGSQKKPITKQWWFWTISVLLTLGIIGNIGNAVSGKNGSGTKPRASNTATPDVQESETTNPFLACTVEEADVMNGTRTEKIGTWGYIKMDKAAAKSASSEEYAEFAKNVVSGSGYNWFSVIFNDQTGINFTGCYTYLATYGKLDNEGCIIEPIGDISLDTKTEHSAYKLREASPTPEPATPEATEAPALTPTPTPAPIRATVDNEPITTPEPKPVQEPTPKPDVQPPSGNTPDSESSDSSTGRTIYITATGKRYHYDSHCNGGTYYESTLEEALALGLTPCTKCVG